MFKKSTVVAVLVFLSLTLLLTQEAAGTSTQPVDGWEINGNLGTGSFSRPGNGNYLISYGDNSYKAIGTHCIWLVDLPTQNPNQCVLKGFLPEFVKYKENTSASLMLRTCDLDQKSSCFLGLEIRDIATSESSSAIFEKYSSNYTEPLELVKLGAPDLGTTSIWNINPKITIHNQGKVLVVPSLTLKYGNDEWRYSQQFSLEIIPFYSIGFQDLPLISGSSENTNSAIGGIVRNIQGHACPRYALWSDEEYCYLRDAFIEGVDVSARVNLPIDVPLRFSGRISAPKVQSVRNGNFKVLTFSGAPVEVPGVMLTDPQQAKRFVSLNGSAYSIGTVRSKLNLLRKYTSDKFSYTSQYWNISASNPIAVGSTTPFLQAQRSKACIRDFEAKNVGLESFVSSNSMMGQSSPPTYNGKQITYQLGGMHFDDDGKVFSGDYQLVLDASLARCVYGFSGTPKAEISITDYEGTTQKVFTLAFTEKNGLFNIHLAGFHFSDPLIRLTFGSPKK